jgi:hypothetical protein
MVARRLTLCPGASRPEGASAETGGNHRWQGTTARLCRLNRFVDGEREAGTVAWVECQGVRDFRGESVRIRFLAISEWPGKHRQQPSETSEVLARPSFHKCNEFKGM